MSARYTPVGWTPAKRRYDLVLAAAILSFLVLFQRLGSGGNPALDDQSLAIKAQGCLAFVLLTVALAIGPLARLAPRFLPLLYNRRHLGVATFAVALGHALEVLGWHFAYSATPPLVAALSSDPLRPAASLLPFVLPGIVALSILFLLAATSHDFWLSFLGPPLWKALHLSIYLAYALVVVHVAFGQLQSATNPGLAVVVAVSALGLVALHLLAARAELRRERGRMARSAGQWLVAGPAGAIEEGRAIVLRPPLAEPIAVFRHKNALSAVGHLCAHQNGPLGEGRVVDGCITCPWHGFQYRLEDGCAPPPYTERIPVHRLRIEGGIVMVDPAPQPLGTRVEPVRVEEAG